LFYTKQKGWEVTGCINSLPKNSFNYLVFCLPVIIFTIIYNVKVKLSHYRHAGDKGERKHSSSYPLARRLGGPQSRSGHRG
jgi:hypothetical protein